MKYKPKHGLAILLAALVFCGCFGLAETTPPENAVQSFSFSRSGSSADQFRSYHIGETKRGRFVWIDLYISHHVVLPLSDEDIASFSSLIEELALSEWDGFSETGDGILDGESFSLSVAFQDGETLSSGGSNAFPADYGQKSAAIEDFFWALMEDYEIDIDY